ncbi:MAG: hypothetical protein A2Y10_19290 [Planctomycetes bacterium GWF2_41_51]|nr:MAG: hypothetical protein A2Y10_19290 [Planctomycetes bacterium GWF2_41_51]HBG25952.1 hypothetical protein [Phycisphaerales bacterium]
MAKLTSFWQLLENRNDKTAVLAEWKQRVGDSFGVVNPLLTPTGQYASAYPHPKPYGLKLRIIKHRNGDIVAVCPEDSDVRIDLKKTDIALYHINIEKLRKVLAGTLSLVPAQNAIQNVSDYILLGKYRPKPAADFSVYMIIAKPQSFISIIKDLCQTPKPFILLTTSMKDCSEEAHVLIDKKSSIIVPLDDVLEYSGARIQCTEQWNQCLSVFAQMVNPKGRSNFVNKPSKKGQKTAANIYKLKQYLIEHIKGEYERLNNQIQRKWKITPPVKLEKQKIGQIVDIRPDEVTRAFKAEPQLKALLKISYSNDEILKYGKKL